jgi:hypothetical protein
LKHTCSIEFFASTDDVDRGLPTFSILGAAPEIPSSDVFVHTLLIASEIPSMRCGVDRRMRLVVVLAFPWGIEAALLESATTSNRRH